MCCGHAYSPNLWPLLALTGSIPGTFRLSITSLAEPPHFCRSVVSAPDLGNLLGETESAMRNDTVKRGSGFCFIKTKNKNHTSYTITCLEPGIDRWLSYLSTLAFSLRECYQLRYFSCHRLNL